MDIMDEVMVGFGSHGAVCLEDAKSKVLGFLFDNDNELCCVSLAGVPESTHDHLPHYVSRS